ncbi:MAG: HigA family addiction module antidote protein [Gammaproteobacteria bacterium]|nr:HigA family addiction module antidote protein [Gammaproteobacteria bacterium]
MDILPSPFRPGERLKWELIDCMGLSVGEAAQLLGLTTPFLQELINEKARITPEIALRLSRLLGTSMDIWMRLQNDYDARANPHEVEPR